MLRRTPLALFVFVPSLTLGCASFTGPDIANVTQLSFSTSIAVALDARFFTVAGDTVRRPVEWRTESPSIASVDAVGVVTGIAAGRATIVAHWGEGQASAGQYVTVNASSTSSMLERLDVHDSGLR